MIQHKLAMISTDPKLVGQLCDLIGTMPNIDFPTMGGTVFWENLAESNGWKLQKNKFTNHSRLLDPSNTRKAWGSEQAMLDALKRLEPTMSASYESMKVFCPHCGSNVPKGKYCKECGSNME